MISSWQYCQCDLPIIVRASWYIAFMLVHILFAGLGWPVSFDEAFSKMLFDITTNLKSCRLYDFLLFCVNQFLMIFKCTQSTILFQDYTRALKYVRGLLQIEPNNRQGQDLEKLIKGKMQKGMVETKKMVEVHSSKFGNIFAYINKFLHSYM